MRKRNLKPAGLFLSEFAMTKHPYTKKATTYAEQIRILRDRGMEISDEDQAAFALKHFNYYRLAAYWLPFEDDHATHSFQAGTSFDDVLALYEFDRKLRILTLDILERVEVSVRAQWAYRLGHLHGAHAHLDPALAQNRRHWQQNKDDLKKEVTRSEEVFIQHLTGTYEEELPPVWAVCEVMSLGLLSRWYANLKPMHTRKLIADTYGVDEAVFSSWLHHLSVVRNICAHHSRFWNRDFARVRPSRSQNKPAILKNQFTSDNKPYNSLLILLHLSDIVAPRDEWRRKLLDLLEAGDSRNLTDMGFPEDWKQRDIWLVR